VSTRDVRDQVVAGFETVLDEEPGVARSRVHYLALKLAAIVEAHGVRLARPAHLHDPVADWRNKPTAGDPQAGANQVRAALYGTGLCPLCRTNQALTGSGTLTDHPVPDDEQPGAGCLGAGLEPAAPGPRRTQEAHPDEPDH